MVRAGVVAAAAALAGSAIATPLGAKQLKRAASIDLDVLQFALTLEHLENYFYDGALKKYTEEDFTKAGYSADYYHDLHYIAYDEQTHVQALEAIIKSVGGTPVKPCSYDFPYTDIPSFITLSSVIEDVGTSAYLGAAHLITGAEYLTDAGAILAVEALHTSLQRAAVGKNPIQNAFQTPIDGDSAYTLATMFITSCPSTNFKLPFTAFPYLTTDGTTCSCEEPTCGAPSDYIKKRSESGWHWGGPGGWHPSEGCKAPVAGASITYTADTTKAKAIPAGSYLTYVNGLTVTSVKGTIGSYDTISGKIPTGLSGQTYVFVTKTAMTTFSDTGVLYGPAILEVSPPAATLLAPIQ